MSRFSRPGRFGLLCLAALAAVILGIGVGSVPISPVEILQVLANKLWGAALPDQMNPVIPGLVWSIRLPRVLLAFCVGASLAVSGAVMQSLLQNPLASSYGLGVSSGAGLGAAVLIVTGVADSAAGTFLLPAVCLCCGLATMGGALAIYELLPAFLCACVAIVMVSLLTPAPEQSILEAFECFKSKQKQK